MKKLIKARVGGPHYEKDYRRLQGYIDDFIDEAKGELVDLADEDNEVSEDQVVNLTSELIRDYLNDVDFEALVQIYMDLNIRDFDKWLFS